MLPTRSMRSLETPSRCKFSSASGDGRPQHVRYRIGHEPIDLFGHAPVSAAQAGFEVNDRYPHLCRDQRACSRRIHIADDDRPVRSGVPADILVGHHHAGGLHGMRAAADLQMVVRVWQAQITEEGIGHVRVVVLTRMHDPSGHPAFSGERMIKRRDLHEIRSRSSYEMHFSRHRGPTALLLLCPAPLRGHVLEPSRS